MSFVFRGRVGMLAALCAAWAVLAVSDLRGQKAPDAAPTALPAGIRILIDVNPKIATVGDPIRLDLDISMPRGSRAEVARPAAPSADISILDFMPGPPLPDTNVPAQSGQPESAETGMPVHHRARIVLAIYRTGKFTFPPIAVKIKTADGNEIIAGSPPADIQIQSVLTEKNPALKDLKKQAEIPEPGQWLLWGLIALAACILGWVAWYFWKKRRRKPAPLTAEQKQNLLELAEADLRKLLAQGLPRAGEEKQFYVQLSDIVKRILNAGYGTHTAERTTSEIMDALNRNSVTTPEERRQIESFLLRCDVVKFAKYVPSKEEHAGASDDAMGILTAVRERQAADSGQLSAVSKSPRSKAES